MNPMSLWFEIGATAVESAVVLLSVRRMAGGTRRPRYLVPLGTAFLGGLVSLLNQWEIFSFVTPLASMLFVIAFACVCWKEPVLKISAATVLTYLVMNTVDYTVFFLIGFVLRTPITNNSSFYAFMYPGPVRYVCLAVDKGVQILLYLVLRRAMPKFGELKRRYMAVIAGMSGAAYFVMSYLVSMILSNSVAIMQAGVILSWLFGCLCVAASVVALVFFGRYQSERDTNRLLSISNSLMEKNYAALHQNQEKFSKLNHDFKNHLRVIHSYAEQGDLRELQTYTDGLLQEVTKSAAVCKSGSDAVDAVINAKCDEAAKKQIAFSWQINLSSPLQIEAIDICAILANQIDNAFDACEQIPNAENRKVEVHIWNPTESVTLFQVKNAAPRDPMEGNANLRSTKADKAGLHGIGIRSIRESAERYGGTLENAFQDGWFISTVSAQCPNLNQDRRK